MTNVKGGAALMTVDSSLITLKAGARAAPCVCRQVALNSTAAVYMRTFTHAGAHEYKNTNLNKQGQKRTHARTRSLWQHQRVRIKQADVCDDGEEVCSIRAPAGGALFHVKECV